jgi:hypothetical protein
MSGSNDEATERWRRRLVPLCLAFGIAELAWNAVVVVELFAGGEPVRPLTVISVILQVCVGLGLIALAVEVRRPPGD